MTEQTKPLQSVLVFDGQGDFINLGNKPEFKIEKDITLEAWIYCQNQRRRTGIISNVFDTTAIESGYGLLLDGKSGIFFGLKTISHKIQYISTKVDTLKLNQWHHIAGTYDGQIIKVYIDGVQKATKAISDSQIDYEPENDLLIGAYKDNNETYPFNGKIAEVRIWKVARTQQEIQNNIHQSLVGNELGLVGYWPLNEGSSNTAYDKTSNANYGIINAANWVQSEVPITVPESNVNLGVTKTMSQANQIPLNSNQLEPNKIEVQTTAETLEIKKEIQKHLLATGLEDYGFWWQEMLKAQASSEKEQKPFRRGRIWT